MKAPKAATKHFQDPILSKRFEALAKKVRRQKDCLRKNKAAWKDTFASEADLICVKDRLCDRSDSGKIQYRAWLKILLKLEIISKKDKDNIVGNGDFRGFRRLLLARKHARKSKQVKKTELVNLREALQNAQSGCMTDTAAAVLRTHVAELQEGAAEKDRVIADKDRKIVDLLNQLEVVWKLYNSARASPLSAEDSSAAVPLTNVFVKISDQRGIVLERIGASEEIGNSMVLGLQPGVKFTIDKLWTSSNGNLYAHFNTSTMEGSTVPFAHWNPRTESLWVLVSK